MTQAPEPAAHEHRWVSQPMTGVTFDWKCEGCAEAVALEWRPEFAGLGFGDLGRIVETEYGGVAVPVEPVPVTPEGGAAALSRMLDKWIGYPWADPELSGQLGAVREEMAAAGLYRAGPETLNEAEAQR